MAFSDPQKIIDEFGLSDGTVVVDLGSGIGFYALAAAKAVAPHGKVYAIDIQQDLLTRFKSAAHAARLNNIEVIHGDIEHPGGARVKDQSADVAIVANVLFQIENKDVFLQEIKRILKPHGRVLLVEWSDSYDGIGPQPGFVITQQTAMELFKKQGFAFGASIPAGDYHYGLIFRKQ